MGSNFSSINDENDDDTNEFWLKSDIKNYVWYGMV